MKKGTMGTIKFSILLYKTRIFLKQYIRDLMDPMVPLIVTCVGTRR